MSLRDIGFALSNAGLDEEIEAETREANPHMSDMAIEQEVNRVKKEMTLYNDRNKQSKKPTTRGN